MTSCDKPYFYNHLLQFDGFDKFVCKLLTSFNKPVKLTIFNKFETFLAVNELITYWFTVKSGVLFPPVLQHWRQYCSVHALIVPSKLHGNL